MKTRKKQLLPIWLLFLATPVLGQKPVQTIGLIDPISWGNRTIHVGIIAQPEKTKIAFRSDFSYHFDRDKTESLDFTFTKKTFSVGTIHYPFSSPDEPRGVRCPGDYSYWLSSLLKGIYIAPSAYYSSERIFYAPPLLGSDGQYLLIKSPGAGLVLGKHYKVGPFYGGAGGGILLTVPKVHGQHKSVITQDALHNIDFPFPAKIQFELRIEVGFRFINLNL